MEKVQKNNISENEMKAAEQIAESNRRAAILLSLDIKSNFEMYAYRIISHEQFASRVDECVTLFATTYQKPSNE